MSSSNPAVSSESVFNAGLFKGKVIFATGAGTENGINFAVVLSLMKLGANACIIGRRQAVIESAAAKLSKLTGNECIGISCDVRNPESLQKAVDATIAKWSRIDMVLAGAAGNFLAPIDGTSPNAFKTVIDIDLLGTFNTLKTTIASLKQSKGCFLAISATLHYGATTFQSHAAAAKAGVDALIRTASLEYGPFGVRVNAIAPGAIKGTEGISRLLPKDATDEIERMIPIGRYGEVQDIANTAVFLYSPAASYITGHVVVTDGGEAYNRAQNKIIPYPDLLLHGGDFRQTLKAML